MSGDATRHLRLIVSYEDRDAEAGSKRHHAQERQRIKDTAKAHEAAAKEVNALLKQFAREQQQAARQAAQQQRQLDREANALLKQFARDEMKLVRDAEAEKKRASRDAFKAWKEANDQQHRMAMLSFKEQREAAKEQEKGVGDLVKSFINLQVVKDVAGWVKEAMQVVGQSVADAREHVKGLVDEMERARTASKEIAALRGKDATAGFTAGMAREAASAGLDVEDYKQFALGWEAYAGQYVGEDLERKDGETDAQFKARQDETLAKQGKKITRSQALDLQKTVGAYAVGARGLGAEDASGLLGLIMAKSKAGASNDEIMANYAKMMKAAELAPGRTTPLLGQITELGMESVGPEGDMKSVLQAATLIRVMAQRNPNEASTYGRAIFRGLRKIHESPEKMRELGIKKGMDFMQQMEAIDAAVKRHTAAGGDQGEFLAKYFHDIRGWGGVSTAINEGIRGDAFKRVEKEMESVNADTARADIARHKRSQEGRAATDRSEEIAASRERSARYVELRHIQSEVRKAQLNSGDLEIPESAVGAYMTGGAGSVYGQGSRQEQEERVEVGRMLRERLLGSKEGRRWLIQQSTGARIDARINPPKTEADERAMADRAGRQVFTRGTGEKLLADAANELKRIREIQEKQREAAERNRNVPLVNPPNPRGR